MACDFRTFSVLQGSFLIPVLFIISLFNGIYSQTTIPGNPTLVGDFEKNEGETVTLSCSSVGGNPLPSVQWYKNQQLVDPGSSANGDGIYTVGSSTVTYNNYTFTVSRSDNLVSYICKVQNSLMASPLERAWTISVYVPSEQPFISGPEPAITTALNSGSTYKYVCTAQNGRPAPNLLWKLGTTLANAVEFHQGITENTTTNADSTLSKSSSVSWVPIVDDNGKNLYCQTVQTTAGGGTVQKSTSVPIVVQQIPILQIATTSYTAQVGSTVTLACTVLSATPGITDLYWRRLVNGQYTRITIDNFKFSGGSTSNANLTINNVALSDQNSYQCSATNSAGTGNSGATTLTVTGTLPTVQVGSSGYSGITGGTVTLVCTIISSNPSATSVIWEKDVNGNPTNVTSLMASRISGGTVTQPSLTISSLTAGDSGLYYCSAANSVGTGSRSSTTLTVQNVPSVSIGQTSYSIFVGSSVTLNCFVSGNPAVTLVFWTVTRNGFTQNALNSRYSNGDVNNPSLTITNAQQSDTGLFTCKAQNSAGTTDGSPISLTVSGTAPTVTMSQTSYSVFTNGEVTLSCSVSANPTATISWTFTSNSGGVTAITSSTTKYTLATSSTASTLTVRSANSNDQGSYTCSATNSVGNRQATATLVVSGSLPTISLPSTYSVITGSDITMTCTVSASPAVNSVSWQFQSASSITFTTITNSSKYSISSLTGTSSLTVRNTISSDNGQYRCRAENQVGTSQSTTVLTVSGSIPVVTLPTTRYEQTYGQNVTMQCSITATPDITEVRWQRFVNGAYQNIVTQSSTKYFGSSTTNFALSIANLDFTDSGDYRCTATNQVGQGVSPNRATLSVLGGQPTPFIPLTSYSVLIGNDIQIPCSVSANPAATSIQWQFTSSSGSNTQITQSTTKYTLVGDDSTTSNLTINSAALTDAGTYRCSATNIVGTGTDSATLTITGSAATITVSPASQSVLQKNTATIQCIINNANPGVTEVSWEKVSSGTTSSVVVTGRFNGSTPSLPDLIISDLQPSDAGTYYCSARNAIGTSRSSTGSTLVVTGAVPSSMQISGPTSQTVNLGGSLTLQCSGQGDPAPTLTWIFSSSTSDATTVGTGTTYSITNAQRTNGGTYVCRGTNTLGSTDSQGVTVDVQYAPIDARTDAQKSLSASVGSTVSLVCAVDANPSASYEWFRSNQQVSTQREYTFTLSSLALLGSYTCRATNSRGSVQLLYTLSQASSGNTGASTASSGLSTGEIAAIILAVLLLLILIIIIIICCLTHGACGVICGKKQEVKGRVEPEKEVYNETQKEVIIPRFHEESIKGKRQPSAVSRKDVDVPVQNGGFRRENDYEIVRYETIPAPPPISTQYM